MDGRIAMITGGGSGLGREIALRFAREGAKLAINDLRREAAQAVAAEITGAGGEAMVLVADVSDSVEVAAMFEEIVGRFGYLDILVNNAGIGLIAPAVRERMEQAIASPGAASAGLGATRTMNDSQWRRTLSVHLDGTFYCTREALKVMEPRGYGKIVNMASIAGLTGFGGSPDYSAAKAGIIGLTKAVAREVIGLGIHVNAIAPGFIDTTFLEVLPPGLKELMILQTPARRLGKPGEIADAALYLASDESSFVVGQVLSPNGGFVI
ncbi:MAG TPA: SDR family NAD(P)-dependent oxidoreductase [Terriglobales bacterium]|nr:SDR family NAD(P)-dependent oxidoreductase [Terriglobales bacterium]